MTRIIIGGDIVPTKSNIHHFETGDAETIIGCRLAEILKEADFTIFNLEVPLTDTESPIDKCGPNLIAPVSTINGLQNVRLYSFDLANNYNIKKVIQMIIYFSELFFLTPFSRYGMAIACMSIEYYKKDADAHYYFRYRNMGFQVQRLPNCVC